MAKCKAFTGSAVKGSMACYFTLQNKMKTDFVRRQPFVAFKFARFKATRLYLVDGLLAYVRRCTKCIADLDEKRRVKVGGWAKLEAGCPYCSHRSLSSLSVRQGLPWTFRAQFCLKHFINPFNASCSKLLLFKGFSAILV